MGRAGEGAGPTLGCGPIGGDRGGEGGAEPRAKICGGWGQKWGEGRDGKCWWGEGGRGHDTTKTLLGKKRGGAGLKGAVGGASGGGQWGRGGGGASGLLVAVRAVALVLPLLCLLLVALQRLGLGGEGRGSRGGRDNAGHAHMSPPHAAPTPRPRVAIGRTALSPPPPHPSPGDYRETRGHAPSAPIGRASHVVNAPPSPLATPHPPTPFGSTHPDT